MSDTLIHQMRAASNAVERILNCVRPRLYEDLGVTDLAEQLELLSHTATAYLLGLSDERQLEFIRAAADEVRPNKKVFAALYECISRDADYARYAALEQLKIDELQARKDRIVRHIDELYDDILQRKTLAHEHINIDCGSGEQMMQHVDQFQTYVDCVISKAVDDQAT